MSRAARQAHIAHCTEDQRLLMVVASASWSHFGSAPLNRISNAMVRQWVSTLLSSGLSAATTRKAVFALRQCLAAAIADERIQINPASAVPLST
jgi:site-specific recombinase XerC